MKRKIYLSLILSALLLTGCQPKPDASSQQDVLQSQQQSTQQSEQQSAVDSVSETESSIPDLPDYPTVLVSEATQNTGTIHETITQLPNMIAEENMRIWLPTEVDSISSFRYAYQPRQESAELYADFQELFAYLYPDHPFREEAVRFVGSRYYSEDLPFPPRVIDYREAFFAGEEDVRYLFYDYYQTDLQDQCDRVFLESTGPICNDLFRFNKGVAAEICCEYRNEEMKFMELRDAAFYGTVVESHTPDSDAEIELLNGTMSVSDAASFFENYINGMPYPKEPTTDLKVVGVDVVQLTPDVQCYVFANTVAYKDVPFDYFLGGNYKGDKGHTIMSYGSMVKTDDVDHVYMVQRSFAINNEVQTDRMISIDTAAQRISSALSANVTFQVQCIELVYACKQQEEGPKIQDAIYSADASWKFTMYNQNDGRTYICYINAADGENFHYYTISD